MKETWLKTRFIRPEDLHKYSDLGINSFKVTGRTGSTNYLKSVIKAYVSESWNGNLLSLWKPLETIKTNEEEISEDDNGMIRIPVMFYGLGQPTREEFSFSVDSSDERIIKQLKEVWHSKWEANKRRVERGGKKRTFKIPALSRTGASVWSFGCSRFQYV